VIRVDATSHPQASRGGHTAPPLQQSGDIKFNQLRQPGPAHKLGYRLPPSQTPQRNDLASKGDARLIEQGAAPVGETGLRGCAHGELLG
jgi:hypothetical protein